MSHALDAALDTGVSLHVTVKEEMPLKPPGCFDTRDPHVALGVTAADEACARLAASGRPFHDYADTPTGLRQLFVRDPAGNMIELIGATRQPRVLRMERETLGA